MKKSQTARRVLALACCVATLPAGAASALQRNVCEALYPPAWKPIEGMVVTADRPSPRPAKGIPFIDPAHGTCVVRLTEHDKEPPRGYARSDYARRQAFNADNTRVVISAEDGSWHLYDANSFSYLEALKGIGGDAEPQWHPTDPDRLYFFPRDGVGMKLFEMNVRTGIVQTLADFGDRLKARWPGAYTAWTKSEGSPSADGRYWCLMVDSQQWAGLGVFTWDMANDRILAMLDLKEGRPDSVSMSPSGNHCVVTGPKDTVVYSRELTAPRFVRKRGEHADIARGFDGSDVYVSVDYDADGGPVFMTDLRTGVRTDLFPTYLAGTGTAMHFSGKAFARPGWVVISTYADYARRGDPGPQWLHRKVFAVSLQKPPRVIEIAHHHSQYAKYNTEPQATVNRDLTRVLFNSNWGTRSETDVDTFMVVLPAKATDPAR